jgi:hypothetical protein
MERRKAKRFPLKLPGYVAAPGQIDGHITGWSENMSRLGILIRIGSGASLAPFKPGEDVEVDIELPPNPRLKKIRSLYCRGAVIETRPGASGEMYLALVIHQLQFRDLPARFLKPELAEVSQQSVVM